MTSMFDPPRLSVAASDQRAGAALAAVRAACRLTTAAQGALAVGDVLTKLDDSPATIADYGAQAVVCSELIDRLGVVDVVGEEDPGDLATRDSLLLGVTDLVSEAFGRAIDPQRVLDLVGTGAAEGTGDSYWTLDPIDGTKGFLRGDQYAIALALIEHGVVTIGVLGCPNLPNADGTNGAVFVAVDGGAEVYLGSSQVPHSVSVASGSDPALARFCESVESAHSDHSQSAEIARILGVTSHPFRIDSQCKYAAVARGDASIYLRLPTRSDYVEKIWDHAAGKFVVEQAGGRVTDVDGRPLDFTHGRRLEANRGVIATNGRLHDVVLAAVRETLG